MSGWQETSAQRCFTVTTQRLVLDGLTVDDATDLRRIVTTPDVGRMLVTFPPDWSNSSARASIKAWAFGGKADFRLAIREGGRFVGVVGLREIDGRAWLAYFLDPMAARRGIATEAVAAFCVAVTDRLALEAIHADVFQDNPASVSVLEKCGFVRTGQAIGRSAARLEPAALWLYRLAQPQQDILI